MMRFQLSTFRFQIVVVAALAWLLAGNTQAASAVAQVESHVVPIEKQIALALPLPPLAEVKGNDTSGKTWQQSGTLPGSLAVAGSDMRQALRSGGWALDKTISVGKPAQHSELMIWTRPRHRVLVMIWEIEPGSCGFSWGEER